MRYLTSSTLLVFMCYFIHNIVLVFVCYLTSNTFLVFVFVVLCLILYLLLFMQLQKCWFSLRVKTFNKINTQKYICSCVYSQLLQDSTWITPCMQSVCPCHDSQKYPKAVKKPDNHLCHSKNDPIPEYDLHQVYGFSRVLNMLSSFPMSAVIIGGALQYQTDWLI